MKRFFWVAILSLVLGVFGVSNNAFAEKLDNKASCEKYGGTWKGKIIGVWGDEYCTFFVNMDDDLEDNDTAKIDDSSKIPNIIYYYGNCPDGFTRRAGFTGPNAESGYVQCYRDGSKEKKEQEKKDEDSKKGEGRLNTGAEVEAYIEELKKDQKYKNVDWDIVRTTCLENTEDKFSSHLATKDCLKDAAEHVLTMNSGDYLNCDLEENKDKEGCREPNNSSCEVKWVGFVVCPGARIGAAVAINLYHAIAKNLLEIKSGELFKSGVQHPAYKYWDQFRWLANILLVIVVSVIVFSQTSGLGVSNYGVKKMLPRILTFAALINVSFWLVAAIVDISNIIGSWMYLTLGASGGWVAAEEGEGGLGGIIDKLLTGGAEIGVAGAAGIVLVAAVGGGSILALLFLAGLALLLMMIILAGRQAIVVMLLIVAPVAFVSSVLPATEGFYRKWKNLLKQMLIIYPICSMMMGGMILASNVLHGSTGNYLMKGIYSLLPMLGLYATAAVIKMVASMLDSVAGTSIFGNAVKYTDRAKGAAAKNRFSQAERRGWVKAGRNYMSDLEAKKPKSLRVRAVRGFQNARIALNSKEAATNAAQKSAEEQHKLQALNSMGDNIDPILSIERNALAQKSEREKAELAVASGRAYGNAKDVKDYPDNTIVNPKTGQLMSAHDAYIHDRYDQVTPGEGVAPDALMFSAVSDNSLSEGDREKILNNILDNISGEVAIKYREDIARAVNMIAPKMKASNPELTKRMETLRDSTTAAVQAAARVGGGAQPNPAAISSKVDDLEVAKIYANMSAEEVSKLSQDAQTRRSDVRKDARLQNLAMSQQGGKSFNMAQRMDMADDELVNDAKMSKRIKANSKQAIRDRYAHRGKSNPLP